ncbi:MAG: hypothetical protein JW808_05225 [Victivallales bacterium]|nr:hypothetical protein [Victivallales bacterium]
MLADDANQFYDNGSGNKGALTCNSCGKVLNINRDLFDGQLVCSNCGAVFGDFVLLGEDQKFFPENSLEEHMVAYQHGYFDLDAFFPFLYSSELYCVCLSVSLRKLFWSISPVKKALLKMPVLCSIR